MAKISNHTVYFFSESLIIFSARLHKALIKRCIALGAIPFNASNKAGETMPQKTPTPP